MAWHVTIILSSQAPRQEDSKERGRGPSRESGSVGALERPTGSGLRSVSLGTAAVTFCALEAEGRLENGDFTVKPSLDHGCYALFPIALSYTGGN